MPTHTVVSTRTLATLLFMSPPPSPPEKPNNSLCSSACHIAIKRDMESHGMILRHLINEKLQNNMCSLPLYVECVCSCICLCLYVVNLKNKNKQLEVYIPDC